MLMKSLFSILTVSLLLGASGCEARSYRIWEFLGWEKREILSSEVEEVGENQKEIKEDFQSIYERIKSEYDYERDEIDDLYDQLKSDYEQAKAKADRIKDSSKKIRQIAKALFEEWEQEAMAISNKNYRKDSLNKLRQAQARFKHLSASLHRSESQLDRVLVQLNDQVLYLKHNLNAKSLALFESEIKLVKNEIDELIKAIEKTIKYSQNFKHTLS